MDKILYQRNSNGSVQQWQIFVEGDQYYTISGKKDGKLVESAKTNSKPKNVGKANETTGEQQAILEAQAKYKKKLESGYSESLENIDDTGFVEPMLAHKYQDHYKKVTFPVISSAKLDGIRANVSEKGCYSRTGKPFLACPHILEALAPFFEKYPNQYELDGEFYNPEYKDDFDKLVSLIKKQKPTPEQLAESAEKVQFWIFDIFRKDGNETMNAHDRKLLVKEIANLVNHPSIIALDFTVCNNQEELDKAYEEYMEAGTEGQMINRLDATYQHKRTTDLLKRKEMQDAEFKIVGVKSGKGIREGCATLICELPDGRTFDSDLIGSIEYMREVYDNKESYIGKMATIRFQNYTPAGMPRFLKCYAVRDYE